MNALELEEQKNRIIVALLALVAGCALIGFLASLLPEPLPETGELYVSALLLDRGSTLFPLTVQNIMWLMFFFGLGEILVRFRRANAEMNQLGCGILPDDATTMLEAKDLAPIYKRVTSSNRVRHYRLQRLVLRVVQQFQVSQSIDQANSLMNSSLELMQHEIELKYNMLRYLVWLIPTLGFIGTVIGIALSLAKTADMPNLDTATGDQIQVWLTGMTTDLGVAFNTTLLALAMAAVLVFLLSIAQGKEETALNSSGQYCLDNLLIRLYT